MSAPIATPDTSTSSAYLADIEARRKANQLERLQRFAAGGEPEKPEAEEKPAPAAKPDAEAEGFLAKALDFGTNVVQLMQTGQVAPELPGQAQAIASDVARGSTQIPRALAGSLLQDVPKALANLAQMPSNAIVRLIESDPEKRAQMLAENRAIADEFGVDIARRTPSREASCATWAPSAWRWLPV